MFDPKKLEQLTKDMLEDLTPVLNLGATTRKASNKANIALAAQLLRNKSAYIVSPPTDNSTMEHYTMDCEVSAFCADGLEDEFHFNDVDSTLDNRKWQVFSFLNAIATLPETATATGLSNHLVHLSSH